MLNLSKFSQPTQTHVPIIKNNFIYKRKSYKVDNVEDGWYTVTLKDNEVTIIATSIPEIDLQVEKKSIIKGYTYHNSFLFFNFDEGKRRTGWEMMAPLRLNTLGTFSSIEAVIWEDGFLYLYRQSYTDASIFEIKNKYEEESPIAEMKGITPELKSLYLFHTVEREQQKAHLIWLQEEQERIERAEKLKTAAEEEQRRRRTEIVSVEEGLLRSFASVGARIIHFQIRNDRIYVEWSVEGERFNSVVDKNNYQVVESGFCMSGDDRRHNVKSMVITAQDYMNRNVLHKWS